VRRPGSEYVHAPRRCRVRLLTQVEDGLLAPRRALDVSFQVQPVLDAVVVWAGFEEPWGGEQRGDEK